MVYSNHLSEYVTYSLKVRISAPENLFIHFIVNNIFIYQSNHFCHEDFTYFHQYHSKIHLNFKDFYLSCILSLISNFLDRFFNDLD